MFKDWADDQEKVAELAVSGVTVVSYLPVIQLSFNHKRTSSQYYAGKPLNKALGKKLIHSGTKICPVYGT